MDDQNQASDKPSDEAFLFVRLAPKLKKRIQLCAAREETSISALVRDLVDASFTPTGRRRKPRN